MGPGCQAAPPLMELAYVLLDAVLDDDDVRRDLVGFDCGEAAYAAPLNAYLRNRLDRPAAIAGIRRMVADDVCCLDFLRPSCAAERARVDRYAR